MGSKVNLCHNFMVSTVWIILNPCYDISLLHNSFGLSFRHENVFTSHFVLMIGLFNIASLCVKSYDPDSQCSGGGDG